MNKSDLQEGDASQVAAQERRQRGVRLSDEGRFVAGEVATSRGSLGRGSQIFAASSATFGKRPFDPSLCLRNLLPER